MAKSKSKKNNGSSTWPVDSGDQTTFLPGKKFPLSGVVDSGRAIYPNPQFIGNMPPQLAGYTDSGNTKGRIAGGVTPNNYKNYELNKALQFRGVNTVYVNSDAVNNRPGIVRDFMAQNKKYDYEDGLYDAYTGDNKEYLNQRFKLEDNTGVIAGIKDWAASASKYFNKPFVVGDVSKLKPSTKIGRDLILDIAKMDDRSVERGVAGVSYGDSWRSPLPDRNKGGNPSKKESPYDSRYSATVALAPWMSDREDTSSIMAHEFGHALGQGHAHHKKGAPRNSIMSYDAPYQQRPGQLGPADINYFRKAMGYDRTPKQIVKKLDAGIVKYNDAYSETNIFKGRQNKRF
jgi:hypothetical protein